ncbi:GerAB/ArcD/ProY family transporter [Paenibacillus pini]|uniref:Spore germination protein GerSB n=1 Tax=Paenibacillus pini JCM 16418 TaxID=1236976 RepID=W7YH74_9BACL|nr:GerAB/ArcD/ProY family transporter [Paenibacillus pini]GAF07812.1 spore germination protein GerSB [Paenibacillus pini JCM 16418]
MKERLYPRHIAIMLHMAQTGVIAFSLARLAANYYGTNGWISILILGAVATFNIFLISIVNRMGEGQSIFTILERSIPRWILMPMYVLMMAFLAMLGSVIGKFYIFLFQLIAFPTASSLILNIAFDVLIFLLLIKGIYNIGKAATIFFCLLIWMIWLLFVFSGDFEFVRLTPFLFKGGEHMLVGSVHMYSAFVGYELSLFLIPYVDRRKKWMKSVYIANAMTVTIYVTYVLLSFGFFS